MNMHTSKRALLMRSVDRRNDSFGADTEGFALSSQRKAQITRRNAVSAQEPKKFALSSQRKLSVLLIAGIVILSASECVVDPMENGGDKPLTLTPVSCPAVLFATTDGETYPGLVNVASGSGMVADPYLIPLVDGVAPDCPISIEFDYSDVELDIVLLYFRIDNMPTGASYTSSTIAWTFRNPSVDSARIQYGLSSNGLVTDFRDLDIKSPYISKDMGMGMGTVTDDTDFTSTDARTFGIYFFVPSATDNLTLTLTPTP